MPRRLKVANLDTTQLNSYVDWIETAARRHTVGIGNGKAKSPKTDMYVHPFNVGLPPGVIAYCTCLETAFTSLHAKVAVHSFSPLPAGERAIGIKFYSPARLSHATGLLAKGQSYPSHITTRPYNKYTDPGTIILSIPFGRTSNSAIETEIDAFENLKAGFEINGAIPAGQKVTLIQEKFSGRS